MPLIAIPNVSSADAATVAEMAASVTGAGARVLDLHSDAEHARTVLTCTGEDGVLVEAMVALAVTASAAIDLRAHRGAHPYVGALDVCPFVPHDVDMPVAVDASLRAGRRIGDAGIPVFFYGASSKQKRTLPELRAGGLDGLIERVAAGLSPDEGPTAIDPATGVVCVGARDVLIAFNIWIDGDVTLARSIATAIRAANGGLPGVRALGLDVGSHGRSQISMNLTAPDDAGIDRVFAEIEKVCGTRGCAPVATEIVGLVPERFLPDPDAKAARLLIEPGRSLETALLI